MFDNVSTYQHFHTIFYDFKIMNGSLTTLSLHVIGDWGLSNVFSFLNIVKKFLVLTKMLNWFIGLLVYLHDQKGILQITHIILSREIL